MLNRYVHHVCFLCVKHVCSFYMLNTCGHFSCVYMYQQKHGILPQIIFSINTYNKLSNVLIGRL